jgi:ATP-dependent helicase/nuclease subunit A
MSKAVPAIPREAAARQLLASDPKRSAWVSAIAGSGKTHVLTDRVIRLLLRGTPPSRILCLTFTRAASANMTTRIFERLATFARLDDAALDEVLTRLGADRSPQGRAQARRLFAQALETPGGLKIETIHAFCTRILGQFPFEAGVPAHFTVLDDLAKADLYRRHRLALLTQATLDDTSALGRALSLVLTTSADDTIKDTLDIALNDPEAVEPWRDPVQAETARLSLCRALGCQPDDTGERLDEMILADSLISKTQLAAIVTWLQQGTKTDKDRADALAASRRVAPEDGRALHLSVFLTKEETGRADVVTKKHGATRPELKALLDDERERLVMLVDRRRAFDAVARTQALFTLAAEMMRRIDVEKAAGGLLDYRDLVGRVRDMLLRGDAAWVLYKLDLGIDHILVDEAQDTSAEQWDIVAALVAEFAAGAGAREPTQRTLFAVGDDKQSIYSFQGADPALFAERRRHFERALTAAGEVFETVRFEYSFRSSPDVLGAVDAVFEQPAAHAGLSADKVPTVHRAVRASLPGLVDIWPTTTGDPAAPANPWDAPVDMPQPGDARTRLARRIAREVRRLVDHEALLRDGASQPVRPGDVLILVRQRGPLFQSIIRALKREGVPVAGADRLKLTEHIAVMDLMALADALLLPDDDLSLATVLRSPLALALGGEPDVFALATGRTGSLLAALGDAARTDAMVGAILRKLEAWRDAARSLPPAAFFGRVLGADGGRRAFMDRLGHEASEAIDEFLTLAQADAQAHPPSLQGFIARLRNGATEIKRDPDLGGDEVRVMTVHGAKGLEAPVVILADTTSKPEGPRDGALIPLTLRPGHTLAVWGAGKKHDCTALSAARQTLRMRAAEEHKRLLYVALTRAEDRLIIAGAESTQGRPPECWYDLVHAALAPRAETLPDPLGQPDGKETILRFRSSGLALPVRPAPLASSETVSMAPDWLDQPAPPARPARLVRPSDPELFEGPRAARPVPTPDAARRGAVVHGLLERVPGIAVAERAAALAQALPRFGLPADDPLAADVLRLVEDPRLAPLFGPGSRAEVSISGRLTAANGTPILVSGQVDRLVVTPAEVMIVDFKSGVPVSPVPATYAGQLALYRAVLMKIYPDRPVRCAVVWTVSATLVEIAPDALDAALARVTLA